ncbi:MAG: amidase family protein [Gammaproteobacteria bacterium]
MTRFAEELDAVRSEQLTWFEKYDVIVCPASMRAALPLDREVPPPPPPANGRRRRSPYYLGIYNTNGWPAGVVRAGTSTDDPGMPLGVQVIGRPWREDHVIAALALIERESGGYRRPSL